MLQTIKCFFEKHTFQSLGKINQDEIFVCSRCGRRHTQFYTLKIDRLGLRRAASAGAAMGMSNSVGRKSEASSVECH